MANLRGGMVLLRFEDDGEINGVRTKIVPLVKVHRGKEPVFEATDD